MSEQDERYMRMALRLARHGIGKVEPNPAVGCIIVKANQIIGKGWHKRFGQAHAEIMAIEDCKTLSTTPQRATMYVTLEPCCHQGKTGPCTQAIIDAGLRKVVVATIDPSKHNNGKGIEQLRNAGIEVETGVCETEAKLLNAPFIKFASTGRCWTVLKWAQSIDGKLAYDSSTAILAVSSRAGSPCHEGMAVPRWISNELSRKDAQNLRRRVGAILVGINTVIADDPLLTAQPSRGKKPLRIVLDSSLRISLKCKLLRTVKTSPVLIITSQQALQANPKTAERIAKKGAEVIAYPDMQGRSNLYFLFDELARRGIAQLLVEGGPTVIASFLKERLVDELNVYICPRILGAQGSADIAGSLSDLTKEVSFHYVDIKHFGEDICLTGFSQETLRELSISIGQTSSPRREGT
jgi:diaminohydroxyphosphoribosylaminopyrimidine deaminase/5-amino-6-(5-phosphoribosylamino)uracil reductase